MNISVYNFKVSKVDVAPPGKDKDGNRKDYPHLYLTDDDDNQITLFFDSYNDMIDVLIQGILKARNTRDSQPNSK